MSRFDRARAVADAVLLEGYVLYPYRATAPKNRFRWAFGVLAPRDWSEAGGCEPWWMETQTVVEGHRRTRIEGKLRLLQVERRVIEERVVEEAAGDGVTAVRARWREVPQLEVGGELLVTWEEGELREIDFACDLDGDVLVPFHLSGGTEIVPVVAAGVDARIVRRREPVRGVIRITAEALPVTWEAGDDDPALHRLTVRVENRTPFADLAAPREVALRSACVGAHLLLAADGDAFVSLVDPPPHARDAVDSCTQSRAWPVLAGPPGSRDLVLASPIILYDHPRIAPESPGDLFDATEIDELLALRTATLTPEEKRVARATDPRAAAVVDRVDAMPPEVWQRLHGAARDLIGAEMVPRAPERPEGPVPAPTPVAPPRSTGAGPVHDPGAAAEAGLDVGWKVRLRPGARRTDAQDLLFAGLIGTVRAVLRDVDGEPHLALTLDDDPAAELHHWYGRFHYYRLDEVEPLGPPRPPPPVAA